MRSAHQQRVDQFMRRAGQDVPNAPTVPDKEIRLFRAKLILEEALETITRGLGVEVLVHYHADDEGSEVLSIPIDENSITTRPEGHRDDHGDVSLTAKYQPNVEELVDGCADLSVVTVGTLTAFGIDDRPLLEEVDAANLRKFGPGGYRSDGTDGNPVGKWIKPKDWQPPNIDGAIKASGTDYFDIEDTDTGLLILDSRPPHCLTFIANVRHVRDDNPLIQFAEAWPVETIHRALATFNRWRDEQGLPAVG